MLEEVLTDATEELFFLSIAALIVTIVAIIVNALTGTIVRSPRTKSEANVEPFFFAPCC